MWIYLVLLYGIFKGARDIIKKLALEKYTPIEVLITYSALSLFLILPLSGDAFLINCKYILMIAIKSFVIFIAWMCSFTAIKKMPVSIIGILDLSRVLFATFLAVIFLKEKLTINQMAGLSLVSVGLLSLKLFNSNSNKNKEDVKTIYVLMAFVSCLLNATSGLLDKILMKSMTSSQLQFWYMLLLVVYYLIYILIKKEKIRKEAFKDKWIWLLAILFAIADKALFIANKDPNSKVTIMTLIKQSSCIITIIGGKLVFKEKNILKKLISATLIVIGIVISTI